MKNGWARILPLVIALLPVWSVGWAEDEPHVVQFTPDGTVKGVRQVHAQFSESMVPFGDPERLIEPFILRCDEKGTARWADDRNWIFDFARDLPAGVRCEFNLKPGLRALAGRPLAGRRTFAFSTGGPSVVQSYPYEESSDIDEDQMFILELDAPVSWESVTAHASFTIEGLQDRIGVSIVGGKERTQVLRSHYGRKPARPVIVIQAKRRFPNDAKILLHWGKDILSESGVATEQDQLFHFTTRKAFRAEFRCERENPRVDCLPLTAMWVQFTGPVSWEQAKRVVLKGPDGKIWPARHEGEDPPEQVTGIQFQPPFPEQAVFVLDVPGDVKDDAGRTLANADRFPLTVKTHTYPPLAKFPGAFGIIEWKADPTLPVTVRNLEAAVPSRQQRLDRRKMLGGPPVTGRLKGTAGRVSRKSRKDLLWWLDQVTRRHEQWAAPGHRDTSIFQSGPSMSQAKSFTVPKPGGAKAFEVVGIPLPEPGLYVVEMESLVLGEALLDKPKPMFVSTMALVTNLAVHFKWGREASVAWVTTLDQGQPAGGALVAVRDCRGATLWKGRTDGSGVARVPPFKTPPSYEQCPVEYPYNSGVVVTAELGRDFSFVHSGWDKGIESWRFRLPEAAYQGPVQAQTILDRGLYRAGDTVHMKHILRRPTMQGFGLVPEKQRPTRVAIRHLGSMKTYTLPLKWDKKGSAESLWTIPGEAKLGSYDILLKREAGQSGRGTDGSGAPEDGGGPAEWSSGAFRVEEFRVPLMKAVIRPPAAPLVGVSQTSVDVAVRYLAGGGAGNLPVMLRSQVRPRSVPAPEGFEEFTFANGPVKEGVVRRGGEGTEHWEDEPGSAGIPDGDDVTSTTTSMVLQRTDLQLDAAGGARSVISGLPSISTPKLLLTELEFRDPNGEVQTVASRIPLWPAASLVGIKPDAWTASKEKLKFQVAVVGLTGVPIADAPVSVDVYQRRTYSHRTRLIGGFYAYEHVQETKKLGPFCQGKTDAGGLLVCEGTAPASGSVLVQALARDDEGRAVYANQEIWVAGSEEWWFEAGDQDRMDLLPGKRRYEPGETATLQVRMPFREAVGLVTVEREGVIDAFVTRLSGKMPVVEVPMKGGYAGNVFVSVLAVRGRAGDAQPTAQVDLGRPAYKLGITELKVGWRAHELAVSVSTDRPVYRVRDKARVRIIAKRADGGPLPPGSEVAVAAVDEGLLELAPNRSWELLGAMMGRRGHEVRNATAQMQVVGKRHYGLKALPPGGGGGRQPTRELFDTLLQWRGRVGLNAHGEAALEVPLNDSLTTFRLVAVATGGTDFFGTGSTTIRSSQDLMLFSGLAPLVREGDRIRPEFTVRNVTDNPLDVSVQVNVKEIAAAMPAKTVALNPGGAQTLTWDVAVPAGTSRLTYVVEAGSASTPTDSLTVSQRVIPAVPVRTLQATVERLDKEVSLPLEMPTGSAAGRGGVQVHLQPSLLDGLSGITAHMAAYPYRCLEQEVSRAVALRDRSRWNTLMANLPTSLDGSGLAKYFPAMEWGSDVLTAYILAIAQEAGWDIPAESREQMERGLKEFIAGKLSVRSAVHAADLSLRKLLAIEALSRTGQASPEMLTSIPIDPNLWPTSAVLDWYDILRRMDGIPQRAERLQAADRILRARLNFHGATMGFSTESSDRLWWLMVSSDLNAVRLILSTVEQPSWKNDVPRLVRGALARQRRGAWDLTVANAWGVLAMEKFSRTFERTPVTGRSSAALGADRKEQDWSRTAQGAHWQFPFPSVPTVLTLRHEGRGAPWAAILSRAAVSRTEPAAMGYRITKTVTPLQQKRPGSWTKGDLVRVRLDVEAQADMTWVVLSDPIPAGATILGTGLGRDSQLATQSESRGEAGSRAWLRPSFEERSFEGFRGYYEFFPKGGAVVEYTVRLNQDGTYLLPPTRAEAMYAPDVFGELPNASMEIMP